MQSNQMHSFPLQQLPRLAFERVVHYNEPIERLMLSLCSKKNKRLIKNLRIIEPRLLTIIRPAFAGVGIFCDEKLELQLVTDINRPMTSAELVRRHEQEQRGIPTEQPELEFLGRSEDEKGRQVKFWKFKNNNGKVFLDCDSTMSIEEKTLFLAKLLSDLFIPAFVRWHFTPMNLTNEEMAQIGQLVQLPHFSGAEIKVHIKMNEFDSAKTQVITDNIGEVDGVLLHAFEANADPRLMQNPFHFSYVIYANGKWARLQKLPDELKICEKLRFYITNFTNEDVNDFLRKWMQKGIQKLRCLQFFLDYDRRLKHNSSIVFNGVPVLNVIKNGNKIRFIATEKDTGNGLDLASVEFDLQTLAEEDSGNIYKVDHFTFTTFPDDEHQNKKIVVRMLHKKANLERQLETVGIWMNDVRDGIWISERGSEDANRLRVILNRLQNEERQLKLDLEAKLVELTKENVQFINGKAVMRE